MFSGFFKLWLHVWSAHNAFIIVQKYANPYYHAYLEVTLFHYCAL